MATANLGLLCLLAVASLSDQSLGLLQGHGGVGIRFFGVSQHPPTHLSLSWRSRIGSLFSESNNDDDDDDDDDDDNNDDQDDYEKTIGGTADSSSPTNLAETLRQQRIETKAILAVIDRLQQEIQASSSSASLQACRDDFFMVEDDLRLLTVQQTQLQRFRRGSGSGNSQDTTNNNNNSKKEIADGIIVQPEEFDDAVQTFFESPPLVRMMLVQAVGLPLEAAGDINQIREVVARLYRQDASITSKSLQKAMDEVEQQLRRQGSVVDSSSKPSSSNEEQPTMKEALTKYRLTQLISRNAYKDNGERRPSQKDVTLLTDILKNQKVYTAGGNKEPTFFSMTEGPIEIPGAYVFRGENRLENGTALVEALDAKLAETGNSIESWDCTVSYMVDLSMENDLEDGFSDDFSAADLDTDPFQMDPNALILFRNDFAPEPLNTAVYGLTTAASVFTALVFSVGIYGSNPEVIDRLSEATTIQDFTVIDWFNDRVGEFLAPLAVILASNQAGHLLVARTEKIEMISPFPILLPYYGNLPILGQLTRIKTSPKSLTALFDFGFLGPLLGLISSFIFLGTGLGLTQTALANGGGTATADLANDVLPSLPVYVLKLSTLGGAILDNFFGGDSGMAAITSLDENEQIPLHCFAIAGYVGLLINAAQLLPLGANDGGRMATAIFGRKGQSVLSGLVYFSLVVSSFTFDGHKGDLVQPCFLAAALFQQDQEIPCRQETDEVNAPRIVAAFALWFLAVLIVIPTEFGPP